MGNPFALILPYISPTLVQHAKYIFGLRDNVKALISAIVELEASSADVLREVEMQEKQGLQQLKKVELWINRVEDIGSKVCHLLEASEIELQRLCMYGYWSDDFRSTYRHGKRVSENLKEVGILLSTKPPDETVARRGLPPRVEERPTQQPIGLENMLEATWNRLMQEKIGILGLYGMGGVGKTTLLEQIEKKFLEKRDEFDVVISVVVSQDLQIERIQKEIGKRLSLWVSDEQWEQKTKNEKVSVISKDLAEKRFVILLDDIWRKVTLKDIGIPSPENGSKVVYTTRSRTVCGRMGPDDMEVKCLDQENAWKLFQQKVRASTLESDPRIPELARIVCEKCKGLPLALNVLGETMACKRAVHDWQHAIKNLNSNSVKYKTEVEDEVFKILKLSYDNLEDEIVQQCLLYCALFPEDSRIEKDRLVNYWICEGIINGAGPIENAVDEGYAIIGILVSACLLIDHESSDEIKEGVTMHDVIRQMALWIASSFGEEKYNFVLRHQMQEVKNWNAVKRMSLENNKIKTITVIPDCANLTTLFLQHNKLVSISGGCCLSMPKLVVLDLSWNKDLSKLPEEVSKLVSLRYLGLAGTALEELPMGLRELIKLTHLDLDGVTKLQSISVISSLLNLESLKVLDSTPLSLALIRDIELLKNLISLSVTIKELSILECFLSIPRLVSCTQGLCIDLRGFEAVVNVSFAATAASLRGLYIRGGSFPYLMEDMRFGCRSPSTVSFQNLNHVALANVSGIQDLTWLLCAPNLTHLFTRGLSEVREIISREKVSRIMNEGSSILPFQKLRSIVLLSLEKLTSIYWEPLVVPDLTTIFINMCPNLKKLPLNKDSFKRSNLRLQSDDKEWIDGIEWEDEVIKDQLLH